VVYGAGHHHPLAFLDCPALRGRLRARATVEHVQAFVGYDPVVALTITVYVVPVAILGIDEIEAHTCEDPVATRTSVEGAVPVKAVAAEAHEMGVRGTAVRLVERRPASEGSGLRAGGRDAILWR
jgi:hypothetical protein